MVRDVAIAYDYPMLPLQDWIKEDEEERQAFLRALQFQNEVVDRHVGIQQTLCI